jgi:hypothetical protein
VTSLERDNLVVFIISLQKMKIFEIENQKKFGKGKAENNW